MLITFGVLGLVIERQIGRLKMTKLRRLINEAKESCEFRRHKMKQFERHDYWPTVRYSHCSICDKQVVVNSCPQPNGIEIGGKAVALNCGGENETVEK